MGSDSIIWVIKILIPIFLPWSPNFGGVVYDKESGEIGFKSTAMLSFENMGAWIVN